MNLEILLQPEPLKKELSSECLYFSREVLPPRFCSTSQMRSASGLKIKACACSSPFCKKKKRRRKINSTEASGRRPFRTRDIHQSDLSWLCSLCFTAGDFWVLLFTFSNRLHGASSMLTFTFSTWLKEVRKWLQMSRENCSMLFT